MADACGIPTTCWPGPREWYMREETLRAANTWLVNHHHRLPLAALFGRRNAVVLGRAAVPAARQAHHRPAPDAVLPRRGHHRPTPTSPTSTPPSARRSSRPPARGRTTCWTRSSATPPTCRSASTRPTPHGRPWSTSPSSTWSGKQLSPRIRDLGRLQLYRIGPAPTWRARYPHAGPLLGQPIQTRADRRPLGRPAPARRGR